MDKTRSADLGNGRYTNPILYCDYSDPDAIRVGNDYYMTASSFTDTPGLPILHSKDLVNWEVINYAISNVPDDSYKEPRYGCGVWAPAIRYHEGTFYIVFPMPDEGIFVTSAVDPYGKWTEPLNIFPGAGRIDPCPFWDQDGKCYLVYGVAKSRIGFNNKLFICQLTPDCTKVISEAREVYNGDPLGHRTTEGPKLYKKEGFYYIFAPAGGVKPGYQLCMRSKEIYGPYETRIVCRQGNTGINGPHQGAWVDTPKGEDWFLHFRDVYAAGRIIYLEPMTWKNGWPVIGEEILDEEGDPTGCGQPVEEYVKPDGNTDAEILSPECGDDFADGTLNTGWQWNSNHEEAWLESIPGESGIVLKCLPKEDGLYAKHPGLLLQKWPAAEFDMDFTLDLSGMEEGDRAGVICMGLSYAGILLRKGSEGIRISESKGNIVFTGAGPEYSMSEISLGKLPGPETQVELRISVRQNGTKPGGELDEALKERTSFYIKCKDRWKYLTEFEPEAGRWVGAKCGIFADAPGKEAGGKVVFKKFEFGLAKRKCL